MVKLEIDVSKNSRVKIEEIIIEGDKVFKEKKIRRVLKKTNRLT